MLGDLEHSRSAHRRFFPQNCNAEEMLKGLEYSGWNNLELAESWAGILAMSHCKALEQSPSAPEAPLQGPSLTASMLAVSHRKAQP
jgi:hypothetical protein